MTGATIRRRFWVAATAIIGLWVAAAVVLVIPGVVDLRRYDDRVELAMAWNPCGDVPSGPDENPQSLAHTWPFGPVASCRPTGRTAHLFGDVDVSAFVLLDTSAGATLLRVDCICVGWGRLRTLVMHEIEPLPGTTMLTQEQLGRVQAGIRARRGIQVAPWTEYFGDG